MTVRDELVALTNRARDRGHDATADELRALAARLPSPLADARVRELVEAAMDAGRSLDWVLWQADGDSTPAMKRRRDRLDAALRALDEPAPEAVPGGFVLVPREPTRAMLDAWYRFCPGTEALRVKDAYRAMLVVAAQPAQPERGEAHDWRLVGGPGNYDDLYECARCSKRHIESADNHLSARPQDGCGASAEGRA